MSSFIPPICYSCIHYNGLTCEAYPDGIPQSILESTADHRDPQPGDHGIQFEQDPTKEKPSFELMEALDSI